MHAAGCQCPHVRDFEPRVLQKSGRPGRGSAGGPAAAAPPPGKCCKRAGCVRTRAKAAHALCRQSPLGVLPAAYAPASDCSDCSLSSASNPLLPCRRTSAVPVRRLYQPWCSKRWGGPCNLRPKSPAGGWPLGPLAKLAPPEGAAGGGTAIFCQPNLLARTDSQFCCSPGISSRVFPSSACCALCFKLKFAVLVVQSRALIKLHARVHVLW